MCHAVGCRFRQFPRHFKTNQRHFARPLCAMSLYGFCIMSRSIFEKWIQENPHYDEIVDLFTKKYDGTIPEEVQIYIMDSLQRNNQQYFATRRWIIRTRDLSHRILKDMSPNAEIVLWWIHLYGIIFELYTREDKRRGVLSLIPREEHYLNALDELFNSLTESERSFVRFMRHNHVHLFIDYPWQTVKMKDGMIKEVIEAHDSEAIQNVERILSKYDDNQKNAAIDFVKKTINAIDSFTDAYLEKTAM